MCAAGLVTVGVDWQGTPTWHTKRAHQQGTVHVHKLYLLASVADGCLRPAVRSFQYVAVVRQDCVDV